MSGRLLVFDVYGELAAAFPTSGASFSWAASVGFQKTLGELSYWSVSGEMHYGAAGTSDTSTYAGLAASRTFNPLYVGSLYAYAALTRTHLFVDGVSISLAGFADFSDLVPGSAFNVNPRSRRSPVHVQPQLGGGGPNKAFTYFSGDIR